MYMKKIFTLFALAVLSTATVSAQDYNLFPAEDVDANGWLWFDSEAKISKYVGVCDEDNYTVDPNGKVVQMAFANITPDYPETVADPEAYGADTEGYLITDPEHNLENMKKGAIILAPASGSMSTNGGCLILKLPACATISLYLSSEARMLVRTLKLTPGKDLSVDDSPASGDAWTGSTKVICSKASLFGSLHSAGHYEWTTAATDNNSYNEGVNFVSTEPVYFALQNCNKYAIFVHGIKVTTSQQEDQPGGGDEPGGGDQPGGGDEPGGGDQPGGGDEPGGGDQPGGGDEPGGGDQPGGGDEPQGGQDGHGAEGTVGVKGVTSVDILGTAQVYDINGKLVGKRNGQNRLVPGFYIVKQDGKVKKVIVK